MGSGLPQNAPDDVAPKGSGTHFVVHWDGNFEEELRYQAPVRHTANTSDTPIAFSRRHQAPEGISKCDIRYFIGRGPVVEERRIGVYRTSLSGVDVETVGSV